MIGKKTELGFIERFKSEIWHIYPKEIRSNFDWIFDWKYFSFGKSKIQIRISCDDQHNWLHKNTEIVQRKLFNETNRIYLLFSVKKIHISKKNDAPSASMIECAKHNRQYGQWLFIVKLNVNVNVNVCQRRCKIAIVLNLFLIWMCDV